MTRRETEVLVSGAGPVGLFAALSLAPVPIYETKSADAVAPASVILMTKPYEPPPTSARRCIRSSLKSEPTPSDVTETPPSRMRRTRREENVR